ncbi:TRAF-type zinc finger domain-containing protein 1 isoform X2 [Sceloporus undulatus]|uniref:TRAF-type zinc finger domain-containing protein 1 isoform X2 n=1 Tax=Sceloporus undulatus TaxID=8520 RepID=UPI001C4D1DC4|nr:TRAF-type zinc finger domain-containing protein 1 isoform X2 [Sceloporus undulatus]
MLAEGRTEGRWREARSLGGAFRGGPMGRRAGAKGQWEPGAGEPTVSLAKGVGLSNVSFTSLIPSRYWATGARGSPPLRSRAAMAALAGSDYETQLCGNCQKEIPAANFVIHEIHCRRNIGVCPVCKEAFPKVELRRHQEQEHTQVVCKCGREMDRGLLQEHEASECPLRPVACQHCDIELAFSKLQEHEDYCGTRTERCSRCNQNVMLRDLKEHPTDCGKKTKAAGVGQTRPSEAVFQNIQTIRNIPPPDDAARSLPRTSRLYNALLRDQLPREFGRRNSGPAQVDENQAHLEKMTTPLAFRGEQDCDLDYLLALSLQQENVSHEHSAAAIQSDLLRNICPSKDSSVENSLETDESSIFSQDALVHNAPKRSNTVILLSCEFCEELYPEEDLILHQTGCDPTSALAAFSKRSSSSPQSERLRGLWEQLQSNQTTGNREMPPFQHDTYSSLMLPCEFCGIQLEEDILFHHQDQCDLRPDTASSAGRTPMQQRTPAMNNVEKTEILDLPRTRIQHQGEISRQHREEFRQQKQSLPGSQSQSNLVTAQHIQPTSDNRRENNIGPTKGGKPRVGVQTSSWHPSDLPAAPMSTRRSHRNFTPSSYKPSFPDTAPTRPSLRSESGRSPTRRTHYNNTEAKRWQAESNYSDDE